MDPVVGSHGTAAHAIDHPDWPKKPMTFHETDISYDIMFEFYDHILGWLN